ncbi:MAG: hypothetical protein HGGPFJEG_00831 [Ignavibacteria bacterium]|nr:hypothetical protein [Ignavibacteria bacterium]
MKFRFPKNINFYLVVCGITSFIFSGISGFNPKVDTSLINRALNDETEILVWIYLSDKGEDVKFKLNNPGFYLTKKSIERRLKKIKSNRIADYNDVPVNYIYLNELVSTGIKIRHVSKWFNAVSCYVNRNQIETAAGKNFVMRIEPVRKYKKVLPNVNLDFSPNQFPLIQEKVSAINYGPSLNQNALIAVPQVHDKGFMGQGVLIASLDAGFDNLAHNCFDKIREKGLRTYDFVNGDTIVADGKGRLGQGAHGTITLSLVCGYDEGDLVSPAFESQFILAKTENTESETPVEEDNWVAAAEWADSLGADVITSSLGYLQFQEPYPSYTWQSMNGSTALITRAADLAVSKGIVVVISAGNDGLNTEHNTLSAPADGFNVITVGSVNYTKFRSSFSSVGPTVDGRIKPDVMALGQFNYCAKSGNGNLGYTSSNTGTSLACPMVAGVCAMLLSAKSDLTPAQITEILKTTADSSSRPGNLRGWGIINAELALQKIEEMNTVLPGDFILEQNYPNPFNPVTNFKFELKKEANISIVLHDIAGREILKIADNVFYTTGIKEIKHNLSGDGMSSGVYFFSLLANGTAVDTKKLVLLK